MIPGVTTAETILGGLPPADDVFARERYLEAHVRRLADDASRDLAAAVTAFDRARLGSSAARDSLLSAAAVQVAAAAVVLRAALLIATDLAQDAQPDVSAAAAARARELAQDAQVAAQLHITSSSRAPR